MQTTRDERDLINMGLAMVYATPNGKEFLIVHDSDVTYTVVDKDRVELESLPTLELAQAFADKL